MRPTNPLRPSDRLRLTFALAGHFAPLVRSADGARSIPTVAPGLPLGVRPDSSYATAEVPLGPGDRLYLYSDGVTEAMGPAGEPFGDARLLETIGRGRSQPLRAGVAALLGEIAQWHGSERPQDDISILAVEVSVEPGPGVSGVENIAAATAPR